MELLREESFLIDYVLSYELVLEESDLDSNNSLLDKVTDMAYKKSIKDYTKKLSERFANSFVRYFISKEYNFLASITLEYNLKSFAELTDLLKAFTIDDLIKIIKSKFKLETELDLQAIEKLSLSYEDKWKIAILISDFLEIKEKLIIELSANYDLYLEYAHDLIKDYEAKINNLAKLIKEKEYLYENIFKEYIDENIFNEINKFLILLLTSNNIIIHRTDKNKLIAMGLYVLDSYLEAKKQKKVDENKMIQVFKALSDPTRYGIIKHLNKGISSNSTLASIFGISRAAISLHFKLLQANDIITFDSNTKQYILNKDVIKYALDNIKMDMDLLE